MIFYYGRIRTLMRMCFDDNLILLYKEELYLLDPKIIFIYKYFHLITLFFF
jgi:hypothetical protein